MPRRKTMLTILADLLDVSIHELDTDNKDIDPSLHLDASMKSDSEHMTERFCEDWVSHFNLDDLVSLGIFLFYFSMLLYFFHFFAVANVVLCITTLLEILYVIATLRISMS